MDDLETLRADLAATIERMRAFTGAAGSEEMRRVQGAIEYAGWSYACLMDGTGNPAWADRAA